MPSVCQQRRGSKNFHSTSLWSKQADLTLALCWKKSCREARKLATWVHKWPGPLRFYEMAPSCKPAMPPSCTVAGVRTIRGVKIHASSQILSIWCEEKNHISIVVECPTFYCSPGVKTWMNDAAVLMLRHYVDVCPINENLCSHQIWKLKLFNNSVWPITRHHGNTVFSTPP